MENITFLGPIGATFSHDAYDMLANIYGAPETKDRLCVPAASNSEVLQKIIGHGGYGAIAMETLAQGRVSEPLESFIELLRKHPVNEACPIQVMGAMRMKIHFCLMVRQNMQESAIDKVVAHPKALGPCKAGLERLNVPIESVSSNGEAARLVAEDPRYANSAALGPASAAKKYGLKVLDEAFEDDEAVTTFFLIGPKGSRVSVGDNNRILIVFKLSHVPGSLVRSLLPFEQNGLNLIQIHSVHTGNHSYDFAIEIEVSKTKLDDLEKAMKSFKKYVKAHLTFGPFEVISK